LFLDTLPYNAHTLTSDALWCGCPVVACAGRTFAGRVAASLLQAVGLPELATQTLTDYEALALELALDPDRLRAIRGKLAANRLTTALFDSGRFTRHLESAFETTWRMHLAGGPPRSFAVAPIE
jgi:predicted O-linked N-acetylglucosamine transferase (SPINDLY family)